MLIYFRIFCRLLRSTPGVNKKLCIMCGILYRFRKSINESNVKMDISYLFYDATDFFYKSFHLSVKTNKIGCN